MERKVHQALHSLTALHDYLKQKSSKSDQSTQTVQSLTGLCKLQYKSLSIIFTFLDFRTDIINISETCKFLNKFLSSYYMQAQFYKQLLRIPLPKQESIEKEAETKQFDVLLSLPHQELVQRFSKTAKLKEKLQNLIEKTESKLKELFHNINKLNDELRIQKQINSKTLKKASLKEAEAKGVEVDSQRLDFLISQKKEEHLEVVKKFTEVIKKIESEKVKARSHTKVLEIALENARSDNSAFSKKLVLLKEGLFKLKCYCNEMLEPKIVKILSLS